MTDEEKKVMGSRLTELFDKETQIETAKKLHTTQSNVSKWINGQSVPPTEIIYDISQCYRVSVDWILGLSDKKDVNEIIYEQMNYEQVFRMIDRLFVYRNLSLANLTEIHDDMERKHRIEWKEVDEEGERDEEPHKPEYDSDYIKINDRLLSYLFRKRMQTEAIDEDIMVLWRENKLPGFKELRVMDNTGNMGAALDAMNWPQFNNEGDWISNVSELEKMTEEERYDKIEKIREGKKKDGR